ncbi:putative RNA-directed DNA polymerase [Rosa chinensis]|uniref:Putative RNA-directed DNA polymerase n=1 Tax=Rosa chinensis TaxID=74649 RepID=A0A2P6RE52_ROSCH|nr:putative RNA-directed DNA polymerase [Rosa chinensis]
MVVLLYVDDMIVTGSDEGEIAKLRAELSTRFDMKILGELSHFLGLEVKNMKDGVLLSQEGYAKKLVEKYGLKLSKRRSTPLDISEKLRRDVGSLLPDPKSYRSLVGGLLYLTITRPDIAFSVGLISRYLQEPRKPHLEAAKKILKYVNCTLDLGLFYKRGGGFLLNGYTDADFGGDLDKRRSTSGYVFLCNNTSVSWCSKKQDAVVLSTTEAEYKAATLAAQECVWLRRLITDVYHQIHKATDLFGDNQSAIKLAYNPVCHARTKHIEIEHHFIREKVLDGTIDNKEVRSDLNVADIFTKTLSKGPFEFLRARLGLISKNNFKGEC